MESKNELNQKLKAKMSVASEELNGEHGYTNEKAAFGYVLPHFRLKIYNALVKDLPVRAQLQAELDLNDDMMLWLVYMNYQSLTSGGIPGEKAVRMAFLRSRWIRDGNLLQTKAERCTPIDEVDADSTFDPAVIPDDTAFLKLASDMNFKAWLPLAPLIWATSAHVFRVRGHHYKDGYDKLYEKTWKGTTMVLPDRHLSWEDMGRNAIHPFGVLALERSTAFYEQKKCLTANLLLRRDAIPCGVASIGTTYAALISFQSTPYFAQVYLAYKAQVDGLIEEYKQVKAAGLAAHISAGLYGYQPLKVDGACATALAPILCGYIKACPEGSAIKGQKALNKHADSNPLMAEIMQSWLTGALSRVQQETKLGKVLAVVEDSEDQGEG